MERPHAGVRRGWWVGRGTRGVVGFDWSTDARRSGTTGKGHRWRSGRVRRTRWGRRSTASAPTSRSSARSPSRSSCACSTTHRNETRVAMTEVDAFVWHCFLPSVQPGPAVRLPRARHLRPGAAGCAATRASCCSTPTPRRPSATSTGTQSLFGYDFGDPDSQNDDDSGAHMMLGVVINPFFDWEGDRRLNVPYHETLIYEAHVKGLTELQHRDPRGAARHLLRSRRTRPSSSTSPGSA